MKKFIFSAVAMVAFVGSSVASNEVVAMKLLVEKSCYEKAMEHLDEVDPNNTMSQMAVYYIFDAYYTGCVNATTVTPVVTGPKVKAIVKSN